MSATNLQCVGTWLKSAASKVESPKTHSHRLHLLMRQLQKLFEQPEFIQQFESGRVHRIAAKIAKEVLVLLEHRDLDACARQQITEHHARRAAAHNAAIRFYEVSRASGVAPSDLVGCETGSQAREICAGSAATQPGITARLPWLRATSQSA